MEENKTRTICVICFIDNSVSFRYRDIDVHTYILQNLNLIEMCLLYPCNQTVVGVSNCPSMRLKKFAKYYLKHRPSSLIFDRRLFIHLTVFNDVRRDN